MGATQSLTWGLCPTAPGLQRGPSSILAELSRGWGPSQSLEHILTPTWCLASSGRVCCCPESVPSMSVLPAWAYTHTRTHTHTHPPCAVSILQPLGYLPLSNCPQRLHSQDGMGTGASEALQPSLESLELLKQKKKARPPPPHGDTYFPRGQKPRSPLHTQTHTG